MKYELELQTVAIGDTTLKLFVPKEDSARRIYLELREINSDTPFPYWAKVWPSALALGAFIQQHNHYIDGKEVLELAGGLGFPALLAASYAQTVCCSDYLPEILEVVDQSITINGITNIYSRLLNWHQLPSDLTADVLLLSDINYDPGEFDVLYGVLTHFLKKNTIIILSTPQRLMAKPFIERLLPWCVQQEEIAVPYKGDVAMINVYVLSK
jgi:methyltransferase-like protein 23